MKLTRLPGSFSLCRLTPDQEIPNWALADRGFLSITYTPEELSIVCPDDLVPAGVHCDAGWAVLKVEGPMDLSLVGVLASLSAPLAGAGVPLFALSTFNTDYLLVMEEKLPKACDALIGAGHEVT